VKYKHQSISQINLHQLIRIKIRKWETAANRPGGATDCRLSVFQWRQSTNWTFHTKQREIH